MLRIAMLMLFSTLALAEKNTSVPLLLNWKAEPEFGGFYEAAISGAAAKEGIDLQVKEGGVGTPVIQMIGSGKIPFGIVSAEEVIIAKSKGSDVIALFAVYQKSPMALLTQEKRGLTKIDQIFESGILAIQKGLPYEVFLDKKFNSQKKTKLVPYVGGVSQVASDVNTAQQGYITSEPFLAEKQGTPVKTFLLADAGFNPYMTVVAAKRSYVEKNRDLVKKLIRVLQNSWASYLKDPKASNKHMAQINKAMPEEIFEKGAFAQVPFIQNDFTAKNGLGAMDIARWNETAKQILELGLVKKVVPGESYFLHD